MNMESELTKKLEELKRLIQGDYGEVRQIEAVDRCIELSKQPPAYAMSRDYEANAVDWLRTKAIEPRTTLTMTGGHIATYLAGYHIHLSGIVAPSPQAVTVEGILKLFADLCKETNVDLRTYGITDKLTWVKMFRTRLDQYLNNR